MTILKYNRNFDDCEAKEYEAILKSYDEETTEKNKAKLKNLVNQKVVIISFTANANPTFYFEADNSDHSIICVKDPDTTDDYDNTRPVGKWNFGSQEENKSNTFGSSGFGNQQNETLYEDALNEKELISNYQQLISNQDERIEALLTTFNQMASNKSKSQLHEKIKIEYSESLGIPAFIAQIDEWAKLNNQNESAKIRKASAALVLSKEGLAIRECLNMEESQTWADFKKQLNQLLGKDKAHYRSEFRTMKKKPYESFGSFISRLTLSYKYANDLEDNDLRHHDKEHIKLTFIEALSYPLRGHLEAEEYKGEITYANVSNRATQLFRAHQPQQADQLCMLKATDEIAAVHSTPTVDQTMKNFMTQQAELMRNQSLMMEKLINLVQNVNLGDRAPRSDSSFNKQSNKSDPPTETKRRWLSPEVIEKMRTQDCRAFKEGNCRYGEKCYRKHEAKN